MSNKYLAKDGSPKQGEEKKEGRAALLNAARIAGDESSHDPNEQSCYECGFIAGSKWQQEQGGELH